MRHDPMTAAPRRYWLAALVYSAAAAMLAACKSTPLEPPKAVATPTPMTEPSSPIIGPIPSKEGSARSSAATTPRAYRSDGATERFSTDSALKPC